MKKTLDKIWDLIDVIICMMVIIVALSKGGFYKEDISFPTLVITLIGFIYTVIKLIINIKENGIIEEAKWLTMLDLFVAAFPITYILPLAFGRAVSTNGAISETLGMLNFSIIYFVVRTSSNCKLYSNLLVCLSVIVGILGFDEITYRVFENFGITYLPRNGSVISSAVQYANVAGIIMIIGLNICIHKYYSEDRAIYCVLISILECAILLTSSRMMVFLLIVSVIIYSLYLKKASPVFVALASILTCGIQTKLIENNEYILGIVITALPILLMVVYEKLSKTVGRKLAQNDRISGNKKVIIYGFVTAVCLVIFVSLIPVNLLVEADDAPKSITKRTTNFIAGPNKLELDVAGLTADANYEIKINQIYEDYSTWMGKPMRGEGLTTKNIRLNTNVSERAKFVELEITVYSGKIEIENFKMNDKDIALSHLLLPDRLVSRIRDSFTFDYSNMLRFEYYKDAIKLVKMSPIVGIGGEGFKCGYQVVQENPYISSEVHSSILQIAVESGIIGTVCYIAIILIGGVICIKLAIKNREHLYFSVMFLCFIIMSTFDLALSFELMLYMLAIMLGIFANVYKNEKLNKNELYSVDNKSGIAMMKIPMFCLGTIVFLCASIYSLKVYRASMLVLPEIPKNITLEDKEHQDMLYRKITILEKKLQLDKFNINYMTELNNSYEEYIGILESVSLAVVNNSDKEYIDNELSNYIMRQKQNIDNMVECEYYNKYALEQVARCYFVNYIRYSEIMHSNFENNEIAYSFFLNYALKLTERIKDIGKVNKVANSMYNSLLTTYMGSLKNQNKILRSPSINSVIYNIEALIEN